jgi:hypothetical protein
LYGGDVVDRLRQHLRQFLEAGVAIELEGVEALVGVAAVRRLCLNLVVCLISISRNWPRRRLTFSVNSPSDCLIDASSLSSRARATETSLASLTLRSSKSALSRDDLPETLQAACAKAAAARSASLSARPGQDQVDR